MENLTRDYVNRIVHTLEHAQAHFDRLKYLLEKNYRMATNSTIPEEERIEAQITLKGIMLLYENYARPLSNYLLQFSTSDEQAFPTISSPKMALGLDGEWVSHELSRLLGSLNYLHNVTTVHKKLQESDYRLERPQTRSRVFRKAQLYYYLDRNEELRISQIHIASPGIVEFFLSTPQAGIFLGALILLISQSPKFFDSIITVWSKTKNTIRQQRQRDRQEHIEREIYNYFEKHVIPMFKETNSDLNPEALIQLQNAISEISRKKLADPITATDQVLHSLAMLSHLYSIGKFHLIREED